MFLRVVFVSCFLHIVSDCGRLTREGNVNGGFENFKVLGF
jgi:hypothetical protein